MSQRNVLICIVYDCLWCDKLRQLLAVYIISMLCGELGQFVHYLDYILFRAIEHSALKFNVGESSAWLYPAY